MIFNQGGRFVKIVKQAGSIKRDQAEKTWKIAKPAVLFIESQEE